MHPYRLRGMTIERPNQVWAMDITYIPMKKGFDFAAESGTGIFGDAVEFLIWRSGFPHTVLLPGRGARTDT